MSRGWGTSRVFMHGDVHAMMQTCMAGGLLQLCEQLQEALEEARASLRAASRLGMDLVGQYATTASAATACMDVGGEEDGDECESKPSGLNVGVDLRGTAVEGSHLSC